MEVTITRQLPERSVEREKVLDYMYLPVLFSSQRHGIFRWPSADITIINREYQKYSPDLRDVVLTGHTGERITDGTTLRASIASAVSAEHRECSGKIRFSLTAPAEEKKPSEEVAETKPPEAQITPDDNNPVIILTPSGNTRVTNIHISGDNRSTVTTDGPAPGVSGSGRSNQPPVRPAPVQTISPLSRRLSGCFTTLILLALGIWLANNVPVLGIIVLALLIAYLMRGTSNGRPAGFSPWSFVMLLLSAGLLYRLWTEDQGLFRILLLISLVYLFTRGNRSAFRRNAVGLVMFLALAFLGLGMTNWQDYLPALPDEDRSSVRLREIRSDSLGHKPDSLFIHDADWNDFESNHFQGEYTTSLRQVMQSGKFHRSLAEMETPREVSKYWKSIYQLLAQNDSRKLDSLVEFFRIRSKALDMTPSQTAEMVVTFIQHIPYVLVHEGSCADAVKSGNAFMVQYHQQGKVCVAEVVAGVQSPYEFVHDLKGDCDTRSLLAYTILRALKIPCSVWISQAYGHSILGVGLPAGGQNYKVVNGLRHFGVELTATGFRLGMIAPEQTEMDNWGVIVYSNF